jgi:hypothetical protein
MLYPPPGQNHKHVWNLTSRFDICSTVVCRTKLTSPQEVTMHDELGLGTPLGGIFKTFFYNVEAYSKLF